MKLLIVEADEFDLGALRRALAARGIHAETEVASDAASAVAALKTRTFDCAFVDYNLPGDDGLHIVRLARTAGIETPIVIVSGHADEQSAVEMIKSGAADYLSKSALTPDRLAQSLEHALRLHRNQRAARRHQAQLKGLMEAALAISSELSLEQMLQVITDQARAVVGARLAATSTIDRGGTPGVSTALSLDPEYSLKLDGAFVAADATQRSILERLAKPVRLTREELVASRAWRDLPGFAGTSLPLEGWLAAPLKSRAGEIIGVIQLSDRAEDDFTEQDEQILVQLAQLASIAIENARLYRQAEQAARARDELLAIVSHDLRNPLSAMLGSVQILTAAPADRWPKHLNIIQRSADRMQRLIQDLLDVTRIEAGRLTIEPAVQEARGLVEDAVELQLPLAAERGIHINIDVAPDLPSICADRDRLSQVFSNLLGNALKFTPEGGLITIAARLPDAMAVRFDVTDSGPGIPEENLPYVFDRFWQAAHKPREGAGLGLPIARGIVEAHGGRIWAESRPGEGSTFSFTVPVATIVAKAEC